MAYMGNLLMARFDFSMDSNISINCANDSFLFTYLSCDCLIMKAMKKRGAARKQLPHGSILLKGPVLLQRLKLKDYGSNVLRYRPPIGDIRIGLNHKKRLPPRSRRTQENADRS